MKEATFLHEARAYFWSAGLKGGGCGLFKVEQLLLEAIACLWKPHPPPGKRLAGDFPVSRRKVNQWQAWCWGYWMMRSSAVYLRFPRRAAQADTWWQIFFNRVHFIDGLALTMPLKLCEAFKTEHSVHKNRGCISVNRCSKCSLIISLCSPRSLQAQLGL